MSTVTVFSTPWCGFCKMAKDYFKSKGVAFVEKDVEQDHLAMMYIVDKTRQYGVPVIQIGDEFVVGFNRPRIDELLAANKLV